MTDEVVLQLPEAEDTRGLGRRLGRLLRAGDLLVLTGDLGAGKTTLTQGLAEGLQALSGGDASWSSTLRPEIRSRRNTRTSSERRHQPNR